MKTNTGCFLLAGIIVLSIAGSTEAMPPVGAGWVPIGSGARALGMGNAFTSIADDATAAWWNPAGLAQLERPEISLVMQSRTLDISDAANDGSGNITNYSGSSTVTSLNFGSFVYPVGGTTKGARTAVSLNYGTFIDLNSEVTASNGYYVKTKGSVDVISFTAAREITPRFMIGIGYNTLAGKITDDFKSAGKLDGTQKPSGDYPSIGILYRGREISFGAVYRADFQFENKMSGIDNGVPINGTNTFRYPYSGAVGVAYRPTENVTTSFDVQFVNLSKFPMFPSEDVIHNRIGFEYLIVTRGDSIIPVRLGYFTGNLGLLDGKGASVGTSGFTLGSGIVLKDFQVDLAYERQSIDGFSTAPPETNTMGVTTSSRVLLSVIYRF